MTVIWSILVLHCFNSLMLDNNSCVTCENDHKFDALVFVCAFGSVFGTDSEKTTKMDQKHSLTQVVLNVSYAWLLCVRVVSPVYSIER